VIKSNIRKKILHLRTKNKNIHKVDLDKIIKILTKEKIKVKSIGGYYPVNFEIDDLKLLEDLRKKNFDISLPVIKKIIKWTSTNGQKLNH